MSQIVPSAQVTLKAPHSQLVQPALVNTGGIPCDETNQGIENKEIKGWLQFCESNLLPLYTGVTEKKKIWIVYLLLTVYINIRSQKTKSKLKINNKKQMPKLDNRIQFKHKLKIEKSKKEKQWKP